MRKILALILVATFATTLASCNKDDAKKDAISDTDSSVSDTVDPAQEAASGQIFSMALTNASYCEKLLNTDILPTVDGTLDKDGYIEVDLKSEDLDEDFRLILGSIKSEDALRKFFESVFTKDTEEVKGTLDNIINDKVYKFEDGKVFVNTNVSPHGVNNGGYDIDSLEIVEVTDTKITAKIKGTNMFQDYGPADIELVKDGEEWKLNSTYIMK